MIIKDWLQHTITMVKNSYNGRFTEYITFNEAPNTNYKLNNKDRDGKDINHKGRSNCK